MSGKSDPRDTVISALGMGAGSILGLTVQKFNERGRVVEDVRFVGRLVFEVERHRAIAGASYRPGLPMSAMETYIAKYVLDPVSNEILEIQDEERSVERMIDCAVLAEEFLDNFPIFVVPVPGTPPGFKVEAAGLFGSFEVESLDEAEQKATDFIKGLNHEPSLVEIDSEREKEKIVRKLETCHVEEARNRLRQAWQNSEEEV